MSDLRLTPTSDGMEISISAGCPETTGGLDTAVYLSLFTPAWWGNEISDDSEKYESEIPGILASGVLNNQTRLNVMEAAKSALAWMVTDKVAEKIEVRAEIPKLGFLYFAVTIYEPEKEDGTTFAYALNWDEQEIYLQEGS